MKKNRAQVNLEFAFCMIIIVFMVYSIVMIMRWVGVNLAEGRITHERQLIVGVIPSGDEDDPPTETMDQGPLQQLKPNFYKPLKMNAIWDQE